MGNDHKIEVLQILNKIESEGIIWKSEYYRQKHLKKRIENNHISDDSTIVDYENIILELTNEKNNDVYLYYRYGNYFVFGNRKTNWIAIFSEDGIIDTAFIIDIVEYDEYLSPEDDYQLLGKLSDFID